MFCFLYLMVVLMVVYEVWIWLKFRLKIKSLLCVGISGFWCGMIVIDLGWLLLVFVLVVLGSCFVFVS